MDKYKVLVVDDEEHIVELLKFNLENEGYEVYVAYDGEEGLKLALELKPDVMLLDLMLPKKNGLEVCTEIKELEEDIPIIMLTAKGEEDDKVEGLESGADDYVTKPFGIRELMARVKVNLKRSKKGKDSKNKNKIKIKDLIIDIEKHEVKIRDEKVELTFKEFELLRILAENMGKVLSRNHLLDEIWGYDYYGETRTVDVHIRYLRKKLKDEGNYIKTIRGIGYKME